LPPTGPSEVYQADLVGLAVVNLRGEPLGRIAEIVEQPAHAVLRVVGEDKERLLPLVPAVIRRVDLENGIVEADWGADW
jgi:16S rRNA processing protein RimM